jgi:hypothetical protein
MAASRLKMNDSKTEIIPIGSASKLSQASLFPITLSGTEIPFAEKVKNLGVLLDQTFSIENHISLLCKAAYLQLRKIARIWQYLTAESLGVGLGRVVRKMRQHPDDHEFESQRWQ